METVQSTRFRIDDLQVDVGARSVTRAGVDLGITGLTFELLLALGRRAPDLVSAGDLMEAVWPRQEIGTETLAQRVKLLRRQLGDDAERPRYIASRRGHGYRLLSRVVGLVPSRIGAAHSGEAGELYEQARAITRGTHSSRDAALQFLDRALAIDPALAPALAHRALLVAGSVPLSGEPRQRLADAHRDAETALRLDPGLAEALVALGMIEADSHRWQDSAAHFRAALDLEPDSSLVANLYSLALLRPAGRLQQALAVHEQCYRRAPADGFTLHELVLTHSLLGNDLEARRFLDLSRTVSGIAESPWDVQLALARAAVRRRDMAQAASLAGGALPRALEGAGGRDVVRALHAALDDDAIRLAALRDFTLFAVHLAADGVDRRTRAYFIWLVVLLGDFDLACALLEGLLFGTGGQASVELSDLWMPEMQSFLRHAGTVRLLARLRLPMQDAQ
jgi:DNA-binding winged helix-turn-helix (wHTH) protein